jgi:IMP dehydrogenase
MEHYPKDMFFAKMDALGIALTYGEVRLETHFSDTMPKDVSITSRFSTNVPLNVPIVSAAMDTVTEYRMGIEMAKLGGLGVIHKNLMPEEQADHVAKVKHHLNALIEDPITVYDQDQVESILRMRDERGFTFHTFPVLNNEGRLVGIITETEFDFCDDCSITAAELMTTKLVTANQGPGLNEAYNIMIKRKKKNLPLIDGDGHLVGLYVFSDVKRVRSDDSNIHNVDDKGRLRVAAAIGVGDDAILHMVIQSQYMIR